LAGIIRHLVVVSQNVVDVVVASLLLLNKSAQAKEIGSGLARGGGALVLPRDSGRVVAERMLGFAGDGGVLA
jgi:hypothetical protein